MIDWLIEPMRRCIIIVLTYSLYMVIKSDLCRIDWLSNYVLWHLCILCIVLMFMFILGLRWHNLHILRGGHHQLLDPCTYSTCLLFGVSIKQFEIPTFKIGKSLEIIFPNIFRKYSQNLYNIYLEFVVPVFSRLSGTWRTGRSLKMQSTSGHSGLGKKCGKY